MALLVRFMPLRQLLRTAYVNGVSEAIFKVGMCLPARPYVSDEDVRYIVDSIKAAIVG